MTNETLESIKFAGDLAKQLITLSTAILTLTAAYAKGTEGSVVGTAWLRFSWISYLLSIVFGVLVLMALAGLLATERQNADAAIYSSNVRWPAIAQIVTFVVATASVAVYGSRLLAPRQT